MKKSEDYNYTSTTDQDQSCFPWIMPGSGLFHKMCAFFIPSDILCINDALIQKAPILGNDSKCTTKLKLVLKFNVDPLEYYWNVEQYVLFKVKCNFYLQSTCLSGSSCVCNGCETAS